MPGNGANKRGASQPWRGRATQRGGRRNRDLLNDRGSTTENGFKGFSLADEARHTSQHSSHWDATGTLRSKPVSFVSAGSIEPLKELEGQLEEEEQDIHQEQDEDQTLDSPITLAPAGLSSSNKLEEGAHNSTGGFGNPVVEDSVENSSIIGPEELEQHIARAAEADGEKTPGHQAESTSFFFDLKGERKVGVTSKVPVPIPTASYESASSSGDEVILFKGRDATPVRQVAESSPDPTSITLSQMHTEITAVEENLSIPTNTGRGRGRSNTARGGTKGQRSKRQHRRLKPQSEHDGLAAIAADYMANMRENGEILDLMCSQQTPDSRNTRDLGGTEDDESDQPAFLSVSMSDKMACERQEGQGDAYDSESELDDATLAKLLQGHVLDIGEEPASNGLASSDSDSSDSDLPISKKTMQWEAQMDDFDPMDWERPSLRRKKGGKGTKTQAVLNTSDDELRESLDKAWKKDRLKKSERKKQREELRAFGMLGKHAEKPGDLRTKYPAGMNIEQVGEEIRDFLRGTAETVSMPPMDTHARKIVHEIANKFNIKSKSTGKADQRRTSLYRTKRTMQYSEKSFDQAIARIHRRFLPRLDTKGKRGSKAPPQRTSHAAASYREGEVVGGAAPELGSENRGRTMLEKMGWSTGTALGALDNKGILQPVPQTMKKSKAGLG